MTDFAKLIAGIGAQVGTALKAQRDEFYAAMAEQQAKHAAELVALRKELADKSAETIPMVDAVAKLVVSVNTMMADVGKQIEAAYAKAVEHTAAEVDKVRAAIPAPTVIDLEPIKASIAQSHSTMTKYVNDAVAGLVAKVEALAYATPADIARVDAETKGLLDALTTGFKTLREATDVQMADAVQKATKDKLDRSEFDLAPLAAEIKLAFDTIAQLRFEIVDGRATVEKHAQKALDAAVAAHADGVARDVASRTDTAAMVASVRSEIAALPQPVIPPDHTDAVLGLQVSVQEIQGQIKGIDLVLKGTADASALVPMQEALTHVAKEVYDVRATVADQGAVQGTLAKQIQEGLDAHARAFTDQQARLVATQTDIAATAVSVQADIAAVRDTVGTVSVALTDKIKAAYQALEQRMAELPVPKDWAPDIEREGKALLDKLAELQERMTTGDTALGSAMQVLNKRFDELPVPKDGVSPDIGPFKAEFAALRKELEDKAAMHALAIDLFRKHIADLPVIRGEDGKDGTFREPVKHEHGKAYAYGTIVRHSGGLWYAARDTDKEPGQDGNGWVLMVDGIADVIVTHDDDYLTLEVWRSSGVVEKTVKRIYQVRYRGVYVKGTDYMEGDNVTVDGGGWFARVDKPTTEPGTPEGADEWTLGIKRGSPGRNAMPDSRNPDGSVRFKDKK